MPFVEREQPRSDPYSQFWCEVVHITFLAAIRGEQQARNWFLYSPMWATISTCLFTQLERRLILEKAISGEKPRPQTGPVARPATLKRVGRPALSSNPRSVYVRERRWKKLAAQESANLPTNDTWGPAPQQQEQPSCS